jgi:hypothetical protein
LVYAVDNITADVDAAVANGCSQASHLTHYVDEATTAADEYLSYVGERSPSLSSLSLSDPLSLILSLCLSLSLSL